MKTSYHLVLKSNNTSVGEECTICGEAMKNPIPIGIFKEGTYESVCLDCAKDSDSDIAEALLKFYSTNNERKMSRKWTMRLIGLSIVPVIWGIITDLRFGHITKFIANIIGTVVVGLFMLLVIDKYTNILKDRR